MEVYKTLNKKIIFLACVLILLLSCLTATTATNLDDNTNQTDTTITTQTTHATNNVQTNEKNNKKLNSDLDTSNSVTTNSIGEKNTSQTTTTNNKTTTQNTNKTNAKTIQKNTNTQTLKQAQEIYTINSWSDFMNYLLRAPENATFIFNQGQTYEITYERLTWSQTCTLRNLTIIGNGAIIDGKGSYRFLHVGGQRDYNIFFTLNVTNLTFKNCYASNHNEMGGVIYGIHKPTIYVSNCTFINSSANQGGAILVHRGNLTITDSVFINSTAKANGGAIRVGTDDANLTIDNVTFIDSKSPKGAAIVYEARGNVKITNTNFINGTSFNNNGRDSAIYMSSGESLYLENNTFINNTAANEGAIYIEDTNYGQVRTIINNTFTNNTAKKGAAITVNRALNLIIENNTFNNNSANDGGAILLKEGVKGQLSNNIYENNTAVNGGVLNIQKNAEIQLNDEIFNNNNATNGGAIYSAGEITSTNSTFTNMNASNGGAVYLTGQNGIFTGVEDTYTNNTATNGGAVYLTNNAQLMSSSGIFNNNNATLGGVFYINDNGKFDTNHDQSYNNTAVRGGVFYINNTGTAVESEGSNYTNNKASEYGGVLYIENGLFDSEDETYYNNNAQVGGAIYNHNGTVDSINNKLINNTAMYGGAAFNSENATIIKQSGSDINNTALIGGAIYNNGTLISTSSGFENNNATIGGALFNNGKATITGDTFKYNNATSGGALYNNATFITTSNTFIGNNATNGGAILDNGTLSGTGNNYYNNTAQENGGAVYSCENSKVTIERVTFEGNVAGQNGGAIFTEDNVIINSSHDVKYINNTATLGGAVYLSNNSNLTTSSDEFIKNHAENGGAIYASSNNTVTVKTSTMFDSNNATIGGAIYLNDTVLLNSTNGIYKNGNASNGSAIYAHKGSQLVTNGNQFINNTADNGALYIDEGVTVALSSGLYANNTADKGAAIYTKSDLNTTSVTFTQNSADRGGAVYLDEVNYNSNRDTFTQNSADQGGAIFVPNNAIANITSSTFTQNNATNGGVLYLDGNAVVNTTGSTYRANNATNGGVYYVTSDATVNALGTDTYTTNTATNGAVFYNQGNINSTGNTYTNGKATNGGVLYNVADANFTAENDKFTSNTAVDGAVLVNDGNVTITGSTIDSNTGTNSVILNNKELTLTDNTISKNVVTSTDGYVIQNNVETATITDNLFDSNTDFNRDMLLGKIQPQSITRNTYIDNFLNDTMEVPGIIEVPLDQLQYFMNVTVNLRNIYNDTVRNGTVYLYDENFIRIGEGVVVDGNATIRIYRPSITKSITNATMVYNSLSKHYQDITAKTEVHMGKTTRIVITPVPQTYVDDKINVTVSLYETDSLTLLHDANITVYINGTKYTGNTTDKGYIVIPDITFNTYGNYRMNATFMGNTSHAESTINGTIEIIKVPTHMVLTLPDNVKHPDDEGNINVTLFDSRDNSTIQAFNITLNVTNKTGYVDLPDENGNITYLFKAYEYGHILVTASVHETSNKYAIPEEVNGEIFIERYPLHFHSNTTTIPAGGGPVNVTFTLYDLDHNLIKNKDITITIAKNDEVIKTRTGQTDENGMYTIENYDIQASEDIVFTAISSEDYKYRNTSLPVHLISGKNITWVAISPNNTYVNKSVALRINIGENGDNPFTAKVNLTIGDYAPVEVDVIDGVAYYTNESMTWPERTTVNVAVSYLGDESHTETSSTATFTVFRAATVTSVAVTENLDTRTVIVGNVTSEGYPPINIGNVTLTAEYTNFTTGLRETIELGNVTVVNGEFSLVTDKLEVLEEDYGRYNIFAKYNENPVFFESSADTGTIRIAGMRNTTITIVAKERTLVGTEESIVFALYDSKTEPVPNRTLIITINGTNISESNYTTDSNGRVRINVAFSQVALNNITARFEGDDYYNSSSKTGNITVKQRTITTLSVPSPIHVYDDILINITLKDIDGNPLAGEEIIANDHEHQDTFITDENGTISIPVYYTSYGTKNITAEFRGSLFYINSFTKDIIQVLRLDTMLNISADSPALIGNVTTLDGYLVLHNETALAGKTVKMYINNATEPITLSTDENGYYSHNYTTTLPGRNIVKVVFETDNTYWGFEDSQVFFVKKYVTDISVNADRLIKVNDRTTITGVLEDEFGNKLGNKIVNLTVNGIVVDHDYTDNNGNYEFLFTQAKDGIYNITVNFTGDDKYMKSFDTYQIKVDKIITHINITGISPVNYGDKIMVDGILFDEYGNRLSRQTITVYLNGSEILNTTTRGLGDVNYTRTADSIGLQNITFRFNGTDMYYSSNNTYQVNVIKLYTHFDQLVATDVELGENTTVTGYLVDESGRGLKEAEFNVTLNDNESTTKTIKTDDRGRFSFEYNSTQLGINTITLSYAGNYSQEPVEDYVTFTLDKLDVYITTNVTNVKAGNATIVVNVTDENGEPIPEGTVIIYYDENDEPIGNGTVGPDGTVEISVPVEPGVQELTVVYNGTEELYKYTRTTVTINVPLYNLNITINDINDTKVRNSTNITGFLFYENMDNPIIGENLTIIVDGIAIANVTTGEDGNYSCQYNATTSGFKEVTVIFLGNETHSMTNSTGNFTVNKINTNINITNIENITVDYPVTVNGTLIDEYNQNIPNVQVTIEINGVNYTNTTDKDGNYYYEYTTSVVGLNNITVYYEGNNTFNSTTNTTTFNVTAHPTNVTANITSPRPGNNLIIIGVTDENNNNVTTGKVTIKEGEHELGSGIIVNGELVTAIILNPGTHTLNVTYEGITKYYANSTIYTVTIPKINTTIIPDTVNAVKINDTITVNGTLVDQYNNPVGPTTINISINGINATDIPIDASGKFTYTNTTNSTGINNVTIVYDGNDTYNGSSVSFNFTVSPIFTQITANATSPVVITNNTTISGVLKDEKDHVIADASVEIWINGKYNNTVTTGSEGNYSLDVITNTLGLNNVTVIYKGNDTYTPVNTTTNYYVDKMFTAVNITTISPIKVGSNTTISGRLVDGRGKGINDTIVNITVEGDDTKYTATTDSNGYYTLNVTGTKVGDYKVKVFYNGSEVYLESNNTGKFIVEKHDTNVAVNNSDIINGKTNITVNVTDEDGKPISGGFVNITDENGEVIGNGTIDENGNLTTNVTLSPGKHNITIVYDGTENSTPINTTIVLDVPKYTANLSLEDINDTIVRNSTNITGFLLNENEEAIKDAELIIVVNNLEIAKVVTGDDGNYTVVYNATTIGEKTVVVKYAGDNIYAPLGVNKTFTVKPIHTNVTVPVIQNTTIGGTVTINGTLTDELGLNVSHTEVIITVNGKNYTTSTDENGTYTYNYTTGIAGENNITVTFIGDENIIGTLNKTSFNVTKINTTTKANITSPKVGNNVIEVNVTETISGLNVTNGPVEIRTDSGDTIATGQIINGTAYIPVSGLEAGKEYNFTVVYNETNVYMNSSFKFNVTIPEHTLNVIPDKINPTKIGEEINITGKIVNEMNEPLANTWINVTINGKTELVKTDENGTYTKKFITNETGLNNVTVSYESEGYEKLEYKYNFTVDYIFSTINVTASSPIIVNNNTTIKGFLTDENNNPISKVNVTIIVNGINVTNVTTGLDGNYSYNFTGKIVGLNNVTVVFDGNENYTSVNRTTNFLVDKMFTGLTVNTVSPIKVGSNTTISGRLVDGRGKGINDSVINITVGDSDKYNATTDSNGYYTLNVTGTKVGDYKVQVSYNGSEVYFESNNTGKFIVEKHDVDLHIEVKELKAGNSTLNITLTDESGKPVPDGFVNITNSTGHVIGNGTIVNGELVTNITVEPGKQNIMIVYNGTEEYAPTNKTINLNVPEHQTDITVELPVSNTEVRASTNINGTLKDSNGNGIKDVNVTIIVEGHRYNATTDENGTYGIEYNATTAGEKIVIIEFIDEKGIYSEAGTEATFRVDPINSTVTVNKAADVIIGDALNINGTLTDYKDRIIPYAEVIVSINGVNHTVITDGNGKYSFNHTALTVGQNNVTIYFDGNNNFNGNETSMTFNVAKEATKVVAEIVTPKSGTSLIEVNVTDIKGNRVTDGIVEIKDGNKVVATYKVINGTVVIPVATEAGKTYDFDVVYAGTTIYANSTNKVKETQIPKHNITVLPDPITPVDIGEPVNITGKVVDENNKPLANTEINVTINGKTVQVKTDENGKYSYSYPTNSTGPNNITVSFEDEGYNKVEYNYNFTVNPIITTITFETPSTIKLGTSSMINGKLMDQNGNAVPNAKVTVKVGDKTINTITDKNGKYSVTTTPTIMGINNITVSYAGNNTFIAANNTGVLLVDKLDTIVTVNISSPAKVGNVNITGTLLDENNKPISNKPIKVTVNGKEYNTTTNNKGVYIINNPSTVPGMNNVTVTYPGDSEYYSINNAKKFNVETLDVVVDVAMPKVNAGTSNIVANITDENGNPVSTGTVTITTPDGKTIKAPVKDGKVNVTVPTTPGIQTYKVKYDGKDYTPSTSSFTVDVPKLNTTITTDKLTPARVDDKTTVTGTLKDSNGKPIPNAEVTVKYANTTKVVKTDSNGKYSAVITDVRAGTNPVTVTYIGNDTYNKVSLNTTQVVSKYNTKVKVDEISGIVGEKITLTAHVTDTNGKNITGGNLVFKLNGKTLREDYRFDSNAKPLKFKVVNGKVTVTITADLYLRNAKNLTASYSGSYKYEASTSDVVTAQIKKRTATLKVTTVPTLGKQDNNIIFKAYLTDVTHNAKNKTSLSTDGTVIFKVNGNTIKDENGSQIHVEVVNNVATYTYYVEPGTASVYKNGSIRHYSLEAVYDNPSFYPDTRNKTVFHIDKTDVTINFVKTTVKSNKLSVKATMTDYKGNNLVGNSTIAIKINGKTYQEKGEVKYFNIVNGKVNLSGIKLYPGEKVHSVMIVTGERQAYHAARETTTDITTS